MNFMGRELVFVDTETDGLSRDAQIWEIALIGSHETQHIMVPIDTTSSDPISLEIGGFYRRHPMSDDAEPSSAMLMTEAALADVIDSMTSGAILVGANVAFDASVMTSLLARVNREPMWHYHMLDIEAYALGHLAARGVELPSAWKSDDLARACGLDPVAVTERHTALGGAAWVKQWWGKIAPTG